jgi:ribose 5-phosphate isomerase B
MRVIAGSDHAGLALKNSLIAHLQAKGIEVEDLGTHSHASVDYPDYAEAVARKVAEGEGLGLLVCGSGQGMAMTANRIPGVRAAVVSDSFSARATRQHNDANVLCLGERILGPGLAAEILDIFITTPYEGGRHQRRVEKMAMLERRIG